MEPIVGFDYVNLHDVDPNFTLLDGPEMYSLRITKAELPTYVAKTTNKNQTIGDLVKYVKLTFTVTDHPKFTGRKHWESLFFSDFTLKTLRRIMEATGIDQTGSLEEWFALVSQIQPVVKLQIDQVPDVNRDGTPNPQTVNPDGTPRSKNVVNWRAGVQPA